MDITVFTRHAHTSAQLNSSAVSNVNSSATGDVSACGCATERHATLCRTLCLGLIASPRASRVGCRRASVVGQPRPPGEAGHRPWGSLVLVAPSRTDAVVVHATVTVWVFDAKQPWGRPPRIYTWTQNRNMIVVWRGNLLYCQCHPDPKRNTYETPSYDPIAPLLSYHYPI